MTPKLEYDRSADAAYVYLRDQPYAYGEDIDTRRRIDYAEDAQPIGVEFLCVTQGVNLDDLPQREALEQLLAQHHIPIFA